MSAFNLSTGARLWTRGSAAGTPVVGGGRIFVSCDLGFCSYDRAGALRWSYPDGRAPAAYAAGTVYVACGATELCALNARTGSLLWDNEGFGASWTSFVVAGGIVYASSSSETVAFDAASGVNLSATYGAFMGGGTEPHPVVVGGRVFLRSNNRLYVYEL